MHIILSNIGKLFTKRIPVYIHINFHEIAYFSSFSPILSIEHEDIKKKKKYSVINVFVCHKLQYFHACVNVYIFFPWTAQDLGSLLPYQNQNLYFKRFTCLLFGSIACTMNNGVFTFWSYFLNFVLCAIHKYPQENEIFVYISKIRIISLIWMSCKGF